MMMKASSASPRPATPFCSASVSLPAKSGTNISVSVVAVTQAAMNATQPL